MSILIALGGLTFSIGGIIFDNNQMCLFGAVLAVLAGIHLELRQIKEKL